MTAGPDTVHDSRDRKIGGPQPEKHEMNTVSVLLQGAQPSREATARKRGFKRKILAGGSKNAHTSEHNSSRRNGDRLRPERGQSGSNCICVHELHNFEAVLEQRGGRR